MHALKHARCACSFTNAEKHGGVAAELMTHEQLRMMRSFFDTLDADSDSEVRPCPMRVRQGAYRTGLRQRL